MKRKLLTLVGLCAVLVAMWNQPVRAGCTWGTYSFQVCGEYCYSSYDTGCVYDGTAPPPNPPGYACTSYVYGQCASGYVNYDCGCS